MSLVKSAATDPRKRREYYLRNREAIKRRQKQWRLANVTKLRRYRKRYARQVKAGTRIPRKRTRAGQGYVFLGVVPRSSRNFSDSDQVLLTYEERV